MCFKPYKGVSSNLVFFESVMYDEYSFKPYKGVSSNEEKHEEIKEPVEQFQTL